VIFLQNEVNLVSIEPKVKLQLNTEIFIHPKQISSEFHFC